MTHVLFNDYVQLCLLYEIGIIKWQFYASHNIYYSRIF